MSVAAIETKELRKVFGDRAAVKGLTLQVSQGEVFGFLGPNGAGKTTSMKMLLGLVTPTSGKASLLGVPIGDRATLARVGFLPEHFRFQEWLTANEFLLVHGELLGMEKGSLKRRKDELLERVGLSAFRDKLLRTYSKGMLQRIGLAQALLNHPALVFLDEPTSGPRPGGTPPGPGRYSRAAPGGDLRIPQLPPAERDRSDLRPGGVYPPWRSRSYPRHLFPGK